MNYEEIAGRRLSTLVNGLRPSSRLMMKLSDTKAPITEVLQAMTLDTLNLILWTKTKDASSGRNRPQPIASRFFESKKKSGGFENGEEFEKELKRLKERSKNGK